MVDQPGSIEERLAAIERRLSALEEERRSATGASGGSEGSSAGPPSAAPPPVAPPRPASAPPALDRLRSRAPRRFPDVTPALVLGWAGAAALVLAAAYLVRLGIVYGWLTPARQTLAAAAVGSALLAAGLYLSLRDRAYAGLLAAAGIAVLYLTVFGAHLHHHLIGPTTATALAVAVAALSLALHRVFRAVAFVAFALAGSYATPLLVSGGGDLSGLAIYLTIWNVVYATYALGLGRRALYLAALYASLGVFEVAWVAGPDAAWRTAVAFQVVVLALFAGVAVAFSIRHRRPLDGPGMGLAHYAPLVALYAMEYPVLHDHLPAAAPWIAVGFAAALSLGREAARRMGAADETGLWIVHGFWALVLFHAVWIDATPDPWRPAVALGLALALVLLPRSLPVLRPAWGPLYAAALLLFVSGWVDLAAGWRGSGSRLGPLLAVLWPAVLYADYLRRPRDVHAERPARLATLVVGHATALAGCALLIDRFAGDPAATTGRLWLSLAWAALGTAALATAAARADRLLARSSLAIFALFAAKVVFFDLDRTDALVRVGILAVLGVALYAGGWIYRRVMEPGEPVPDRSTPETRPFG